MSEIAIAFDVRGFDEAIALDERLGAGPEYAKIGLELFTAAGPEVVRALTARGRRVFLDLKLHDIPNTVQGAARSAARLGVDLLTVHAMGGHPMVAAAVAGAAQGGGATRVVGVTVLTSFDGYTVPPGFQRPFHTVLVVAKLADLVEAAGGHGIVCSATELPFVLGMRQRPIFAITPGIRPAGVAVHDQARVTTPADAVRAGAGMLVLGRAITAAADPRAALAAVRAEMDAATSAPAGA